MLLAGLIQEDERMAIVTFYGLTLMLGSIDDITCEDSVSTEVWSAVHTMMRVTQQCHIGYMPPVVVPTTFSATSNYPAKCLLTFFVSDKMCHN